MAKTRGWLDLDGDGRRMERIIKFCETMVTKQIGKGDDDLALAYIDRLIKASNMKLSIQDMVIGFKELRKLATGEFREELTQVKLKALR